ncbi:MAG TPA: PorV/PorQ family protein [Bacteroidota bacterium]|nr:PorV/PorQ family protein [Bacteroidota bacterium]
MFRNLISISAIVVSVAMSQTKVGSTAAPFLTMGIGPRAIAMGGAFVATADDITALYWNPAGAARMGTNSALFSHTRWFADITYNWVGVLVSLDQLGTVGLSLTYLDYGEMEVTTLREQEGTGEFFSAHDLSASLTYAYNLTDRFSLGGNIKYISQKIWNTSADAIAIDLGTLFHSEISGLRIGATISNFGTNMQLDGKDLFVLHDINSIISGNNDQILSKLRTDAYPLPLMFRIGLAKDVALSSTNRITVGVDAQHPNDNEESLNAGIEYIFNNILSLRAGYKSLFSTNAEEGITLGLGIKHRFSSNFLINVDYAYQDYGVLDFTQHIAVGVIF